MSTLDACFVFDVIPEDLFEGFRGGNDNAAWPTSSVRSLKQHRRAVKLSVVSTLTLAEWCRS